MEACCPYCMTAAAPGGPCPGCGRDPGTYRPASHHFPPGALLHDRYRIGRVLGEGGFGVTYLGRDIRLDRLVAVKEYFPTVFVTRETSLTLDVTCHTARGEAAYQRGREKFLQEARVMARLDGIPQIVRVLDHFPEHNTAYIVMEFLEGETLKDLCARQGPLSPEVLLPMLEPVLRAMEAMHQTGVIHRDISPDNLMRMPDGALKLMDFGCARDLEGGPTETVTLKHGFAPREQYTGRGQGPWTDVYALCATAYYCLTGKVPPWATERDDSEQDPLTPPRQLGVPLTASQEAALLKGLAVRPQNRWQSAAQLLEALGREEDAPEEEEKKPEETAPEEKGPPAPEPKPAGRPSPRVLALAAACAVLLAGGIAAYLALGRDDPPRDPAPLTQDEEDPISSQDGQDEGEDGEEEALTGILLPEGDTGGETDGEETEDPPQEDTPPAPSREDTPSDPAGGSGQTVSPSQPAQTTPTLEELTAQAESAAANGQYSAAEAAYRQMRSLGYITDSRLAQDLCDLGYQAMRDEEYSIAAGLFQSSSDLGCLEGTWYLALCYQYGTGLTKSSEKAFQLHLFLAQKDYSPGVYYDVATAYTDGVGTARNPEQAIYWWNKYLDSGSTTWISPDKVREIIAQLEAG